MNLRKNSKKKKREIVEVSVRGRWRKKNQLRRRGGDDYLIIFFIIK